ncbi:VOC family protein [Paenibacillus sp. HJL G12]|uniref:VOC family protein n=1 Tax=Paenibacillus dendrobii TaxID=2691084 RepID=A0A7X3ILW8_9BACL|nr:VOC family protein [Paenibacillus dendrobii]MWV45836.1 VOC family protein [Paenibacillus dendrobii]
MNQPWTGRMPAVQFRTARPTHQIEKITEFYRDGLGLQVIGSFQNHQGYDGVMFGMPDHAYHLEFTQHEHGTAVPPPSEDNLLVFYIPDQESRDEIANRLHRMGYPAVPSENPYWDVNGITICDPDGWRIVLQNTSGI